MAKKFKKEDIRFLVLDVDGVLTDGGMYYSNSGDEFKKFNTKDGMGIKEILKKGVKVGFLSNGKNDALIKNRAELLKVKYVYVGNENKLKVLDKWLKKLKLTYNNVAYVGDDINDLEVMGVVGLSACPGDAVKAVKAKAGLILSKNGGEGCVRELIDEYLM